MMKLPFVPAAAPYIAAAATIFAWSAGFPVIKFAMREIEPIPLAALRFAITALCAALWLAYVRTNTLSWRDLATFGFSGLVGIAAYNILRNTGQSTISAGAASFIISLQSIVSAILAMVFLGEQFNRWAWLGTFIGLGGVAMIAVGQPGGLTFGAGAVLVLASAVCSGISYVVQRSLLRRYDPIVATSMDMLAGTAFLLPWLAVGLEQGLRSSSATIAAVLFLGIVTGAAGYLTWMITLRSFGAARAVNLLYLVPPLVLAIEYVLLGTTPSATTILGGAITMAGVVLVATKGRAS
jgi:drug/metabolite transporter (DMT)-like permease